MANDKLSSSKGSIAERKALYLEALQKPEVHTVKMACEIAGISYPTVSVWRKKYPDFRKQEELVRLRMVKNLHDRALEAAQLENKTFIYYMRLLTAADPELSTKAIELRAQELIAKETEGDPARLFE